MSFSLRSLFFLFSLCFVSVFSSSLFFLQFSHQAPELADTRVSLKINDKLVPETIALSYGETVPFINITDYQIPDQPGAFNLLVVNSSASENITQGSYVFDSQDNSYFLINEPNPEDQTVNTGLWVKDTFSDPQINYGLWRVANFAPVNQNFSLYVNGEQQKNFNWSSVSAYSTAPNGAVIFEVYTNTTNKTVVASEQIIITSGSVSTVVFNGEENSFKISVILDANYFSTYNTCFVRIVNSVAAANYSSLQPVFIPGKYAPFPKVGYAEVTEYVGMDDQEYTVYFPQEDEDYLTAAHVTFDCESSQHYTLTYEGLPDSTRIVSAPNPTPLTATSTIDNDWVMPYNESGVRLSFLSTSYAAGPISVVLNSEPYPDLIYGQSSLYYNLTGDIVNITLVYNKEQIFKSNFSVEPGERYSYFISGLANSETYVLAGNLVEDSTPDSTPTTTTTTSTTHSSTTGGSTTGSSDDDDLSGGEIAGIVIGVIVGVALFGGLIFWFIRRQRRSQFSTIG